MAVKRRIKERYDTLDVIGKGGMGLVYKAYDTVVGREVALKTLRDSPSKMALDLFRKECGILASMSHPNIVEIFDIGEFQEDGATKPYFVMPLLPGVTLDQLIRTSSQRLSVDRTVEIMLQTCRGLHAAHERGLVHRDLKPSNIFVMPDDTIKIIDFGVAHMADTTATMTVAGGTLPYMAPEQLEMKPASPLSDIFSLGTVLYELLTDTKLFAGNDATEIMYNVSQLRPVPASRINRKVPAMLDLVIAKALEKDANERYQDAHQFASDLRACLNELGVQLGESDTTQRIERSPGALPAAHDKTEKLAADQGDATVPVDARIHSARPQNIIVDANTRLAISQVFDSSAALARLTDPDKKDHARLIASPRPANFLVRIWRDLEMRLLFGLILAATLAGIYLAAY